MPYSSPWGEVFGDDVVAAAMIDRLVHHAEVIAPFFVKGHVGVSGMHSIGGRGERGQL